MCGINIDVIIPIYNCEEYVAKAVSSVQKQTYTVSKIIICDDGSTDRSREIVEELAQVDSRIILLKLSHYGVSAARNVGIKASTAEYIAFLDADDVWLPTKIERQLEVFQSSSEKVGLVHSSYFYINTEGMIINYIPVKPPQIQGDIFIPLLFEQYVFSGSASSAIVRRNILEQVGYFDEDLFFGEDRDLWIRLAKVCHVSFTPESVVGIRVHDKSMQRRIRSDKELQFFKQHLRIYAKWPEEVKKRVNFIRGLRYDAINILLSLRKHPKKIIKFYRYLFDHKNDFSKKLFNGPIDFCWYIGLTIIYKVYSRLIRKPSINGK